MLLANRSKSCQKVKESSKGPKSFKGLKNLQKPSIRRNVYQNTNPLSIEELELPLKLGQFFVVFLLGPKALSRPLSLQLSTKQS